MLYYSVEYVRLLPMTFAHWKNITVNTSTLLNPAAGTR